MLIVPGRPSSTGLMWWIYASDGARPSPQDFKLTIGPKESASSLPGIGAIFTIHGLGRGGEPAEAKRSYIVATTGLQADTAYALTHVRSNFTVASRTLPARESFKPVSLGFGSCYGRVRGKGVDAWTKLNSIFNDPNNPLRFRVLCGDQIYLDLDPADDGAVKTDKPPLWRRYLEQWQFLPFQQFLVSSPTMVMADDHEFWNNYPDRYNLWNWWAEDELGGPVGREFDRAFSVFQAALNIAPEHLVDDATDANKQLVDGMLQDQARTFELDLGYVTVLMLDVRTRRTSMSYNGGRPELAASAFPNMPNVRWLANTVNRIRHTDVPCVVILSQPLIEFPRTSNLSEENLPEYANEFAQLWDTIFDSNCRALVLSGDIHWSRLYCATSARNPEREMYEFISSPLARIKSWIADPRLPDRREGSVQWESKTLKGEGKWHRWEPGIVTDDVNNYATITFTPAEQRRGTPVKVEAIMWPLFQPTLYPIRYKEFILKPQ